MLFNCNTCSSNTWVDSRRSCTCCEHSFLELTGSTYNCSCHNCSCKIDSDNKCQFRWHSCQCTDSPRSRHSHCCRNRKSSSRSLGPFFEEFWKIDLLSIWGSSCYWWCLYDSMPTFIYPVFDHWNETQFQRRILSKRGPVGESTWKC